MPSWALHVDEANATPRSNGSFWLTTTRSVPNDVDLVHGTVGRVTNSYRVSNMRRGLRSRDRENLRICELTDIVDGAPSSPR